MDKPLTRNIKGDGSVTTLKDYQQSGGYEGLRKALSGHTPLEIQQQVKDSGLRGRGGAGFPTGAKWSFVPMGENAPATRYLVVNADEMEPGTFKDRLLMEGDPHQLIEGVIISAYAIQASTAYIFLRGEYHLAARRIRAAIAEAYENRYLGAHIIGSDFSLELHLHTSAGRYICGEETALINALEGKRATPRAKPPFPQAAGLFGKPTIVNNVETLSNIPHIVNHGVEWYKSLSRSADAGTKLYGVSGRVKRPAIWELPLGVTAREIIEGHAGGMQDGFQLRGFMPGGASTDFLLPEHLDVPMDYGSIGKAGSRLGTGTMILLDDKTCPVEMVLNLERFFAQESCGWCTPCRDGLPWVATLLEDLLAGRGRAEDLATLEWMCSFLGPGNTFCALAPGAMEPLQSALKYFRADFEKYLNQPALAGGVHV
ncbi:NADH-quinone oxidoreductase subunit NuoF [Candidatus Methylospira mobilis]|uniref:NADH-quinone oxidoreductase subunit F n=1 Tax=Candidatus Methylospira mobilis TaxID=1808979 RepID=A0A5Q0BRW2_9GAMM|nr:NADH-quinone oxidoreductase subunit NuoF [Candidatus Methylospira mobilis]QFY44934.1 NADH-quinone oxidoreductase subunit NuoF [Candidatus Methylospira mobilis]WNV02919.1 NADH-quinone oxidoreductase subunit NuoF [Candidatus Methylospira mobilis]